MLKEGDIFGLENFYLNRPYTTSAFFSLRSTHRNLSSQTDQGYHIQPAPAHRKNSAIRHDPA